MINIAIDGTTSSGKSTLAEELARRLAFKRLDTGAIYRAIACAYRERFDHVDEKFITEFAKTMDVKVYFVEGKQHVKVNGVDETPFIRTEQISLLTSEISPFKVVRDKVLGIQRQYAKNNDCVMEGRDITTVVLPNADVKFFITATSEERAKRRYLQYAGKKKAPTFEQVLSDLRLRDERDENRKYGRLEVARDAIVIDTTGKNIDEVASMCEAIIREKIKKNGSK